MPTVYYHKLENIELTGLVISDDISHTGIRSDVAKTLSGGTVVWEIAEPTGRSIDMTGDAESCWLTRQTMQSLQAMASVPGAVYVLTLQSGEILSVRFRNEDPPAVSGTPIVARPNQATGDYYNNIMIKLMEV